MPISAKSLGAQAMQLPPSERLALVDQLLDTLDTLDEPDASTIGTIGVRSCLLPFTMQ